MSYLRTMKTFLSRYKKQTKTATNKQADANRTKPDKGKKMEGRMPERKKGRVPKTFLKTCFPIFKYLAPGKSKTVEERIPQVRESRSVLIEN